MPVLWLVLMVCVVAAILRYVVNCGGPQEVGCLSHVPSVRVTPGRTFAELTGRLTWSISVLLFALTALMTYSAVCWTSFKTVRTVMHRAIFMGLLVAIPVIYKHMPGGQRFAFNEHLLQKTVYAVANADFFVSAVEILGTSALFMLGIAVSLILLQAMEAAGGKVTERVTVLARHQERVRLLLYAGAFTLVAGTLQASALYSWAASMLAPGTVAGLEASAIPYFAKSADLSQAMGMLNGPFYSILLASIFVPAFVILRAKTQGLAQEAEPDANPVQRKKWLEENALGGSVPMQFKTLAALLAPILAGGPLTALLDLLKSS